MERESERGGISENVIINIEPVNGVDSYRLQVNICPYYDWYYLIKTHKRNVL